MLSRSSVPDSKTLDSRSGQKTSVLPKSLQGKNPLPTSTVSQKFGRLSWLSSAPQWQRARGEAWGLLGHH